MFGSIARPQRSNRLTKAKWEIPATHTEFDMAELDDWEDKIIWGPSAS